MTRINKLLEKIEDLKKKIDEESMKSLKRKYMLQEEIEKLEEERFKAGHKGDVSSVERINIQIKKLTQESNSDNTLEYKSEIKTCKLKITKLINDYYGKGIFFEEILNIEEVPQDTREDWLKSTGFGQYTGYLFVDAISHEGNYWRYYNPITGRKLYSNKLNALKVKIINNGEELYEFDDKLVDKSKIRDKKLNPPVDYGWNRPKAKKKDSKKSVKTGSIKKVVKTEPVKKPEKPKYNNPSLGDEIEKIKISTENEKENHAVILDYLSRGYLNREMTKFGGKPIAQAVGVNHFTFLELAPKKDVDLEIQELVYIGKGKRDKIYRVLGKLELESLTATSRIELQYVIEDIVEANMDHYVDFFNNAKSLSWDLHELGLLPGVGGKTVRSILKERERKKFRDIEDLKARVPSLKNPEEKIVKKIMEEIGLMDSRRKHKHYLFIEPPRPKMKKKKRRR